MSILMGSCVGDGTGTALTVVMFPYAYSCEDFPADAENLMEAGLGAAKAMRMSEGQSYQTGQACDLTYRWVILTSPN